MNIEIPEKIRCKKCNEILYYHNWMGHNHFDYFEPVTEELNEIMRIEGNTAQ